MSNSEVNVRVTNAPSAYDGFGTRTILDGLKSSVLPFQSFRMVAIQSDAFDWQVSRYFSGMYVTQTVDDFDEKFRVTPIDIPFANATVEDNGRYYVTCPACDRQFVAPRQPGIDVETAADVRYRDHFLKDHAS